MKPEANLWTQLVVTVFPPRQCPAYLNALSWVATKQPSEHETGKSDEMQTCQCGREPLVVAGQAAASGHPGKGAFHHPSPGQEHEALLGLWQAIDLQLTAYPRGGDKLTVACGWIKADVGRCFRRPSSTFASVAAASAYARTATRRMETSEPSAWRVDASSFLPPKGVRYDQCFKEQVVAASQDRMSIQASRAPLACATRRCCPGWEKKRRSFPPSWTRCCPVSGATYLNSMSFGALCKQKRKPSGCGWPFADAPARPWLGHWATAACKARAICGRVCRRAAADVRPAATSGMPTPPCFQREPPLLRQGTR